MNEKQALQILEETDSALAQAAADAVSELDTVEATIAQHEAALLEHRRTGRGILAAHEAHAFLESFNRFRFPSQTAINAATADAQRKQDLTSQRRRLVADARELFIGSNGERLTDAIQTIVTARSKGRDAWRQKMASAIQELERKTLLNEPISSDEGKRLEVLDRALANQDWIFNQANNALLKFRAQPTSALFNEARQFANQIDYEATP